MDTDVADRLMQNIRTNLPGALDTAIQNELYNTVSEFLDGSDVWREDLNFKTKSGTASYELYTAEAEVLRLLSLVNADGVPVQATMMEPATVLLNTTPSQVQTFTATVSYKQNQTDTNGYPEFPDWIALKYELTLLSGVLGRMMTQPAKPYTNPALSTFHLRKFRSGMAKAKAQASHKNLYDGQAWVFPGTFAPSRRQ